MKHFSLKTQFTSALLYLCLFSPSLALAWGGRGHHQICEAATFLLKEEGLRSFMRSRSHRLGHLCNIPDIFWRNLSPTETQLGNPSHFINPESVDQEVGKLDTDYKHLLKKGATHEKLGSLWWRAGQFFERSVKLGKQAKRSKAPKNPVEEQSDSLPYNQAVYEMHVSMGLLGHFVGDVAMPFHNRIDYDGRATGRGGIHKFYEESCVDTFAADLSPHILSAAWALKDDEAFLNSRSSVVERMRAMSVKAAPEARQIEALDVVIHPSSNERRVAVRKPLAEACPPFENLVTQQLGRSARMLAMLWDEIYVKSGRPDLSAYQSYRYPLKPEFIAPDYLPAP